MTFIIVVAAVLAVAVIGAMIAVLIGSVRRSTTEPTDGADLTPMLESVEEARRWGNPFER
jgi:flagellar basal body-associated protein FliL